LDYLAYRGIYRMKIPLIEQTISEEQKKVRRKVIRKVMEPNTSPTMPSPAALQSLLFDSGLFGEDDFELQSSAIESNNISQTTAGRSRGPSKSDDKSIYYNEYNNIDDKDYKVKERMNKKKNREKQRRQ